MGCSPQSGGTGGPGGGWQVRPLEQNLSWGFLWTSFMEGALSGEGGHRDQGLQKGAPQGLASGAGSSGARLHRREGSGLLCPCASPAGVEVCCRVEHGVRGVLASRGRQLALGNDTCLEKGTGATLPAPGTGTAARWEDLGQALQRLRRCCPQTSHQRHIFYFGEIRTNIFNALENLGCVMAEPMSCWIYLLLTSHIFSLCRGLSP